MNEEHRALELLPQFGRLVRDDEKQQDLVLYAADTPNSWKVGTLLEELRVPYDVVNVDIMSNQQKQPSYTAMNPNGRTPVLLDRSANPPFSVFESNAILLFLADKYASPLLPRDPEARSEVEQWLMWQISALGPMFGQCMYFKRIATTSVADIARLQFGIDRFHAECVRLVKILDARLANRDYICGPGRGVYTLADIACWGYAASFFWAGIDVEGLAALQRWLSRLGERPAVVAGARVPGVPILGATGVLFEDMRTDASIQDTLTTGARRAGRPFFNWDDMKALAGTQNVEVFAGQPEFQSRHGSSQPSSRGRPTTPPPVAWMVVGMLAGLVIGRNVWGAR